MTTARKVGVSASVCAAVLALWIAPAAVAVDPDASEAAISIRLAHPEAQLERILKLFEGAKAPHPAAALAAWRRATRDPNGLGKPLEALITLFNPEMKREFALLDGLSGELRLGKDGGPSEWFVRIPRDEGTLAAIGTAFALTDGAIEPPLADGTSVVRIGAPGSALAALSPGLVVASTRQELARAIALGAKPEHALMPIGFHGTLRPKQALGASNLSIRRISAALDGLGIDDVKIMGTVDGEQLRLRLDSSTNSAAATDRQVAREWLRIVPDAGTTGVFSCALRHSAGRIDRIFNMLDRVEKADPRFAKTATIRTRVNLLLNAAGIRPELEVWPKIVGITGFVAAPSARGVRGFAIALHVVEQSSAERIHRTVLPRLAGLWRVVDDRPWSTAIEGSTVLIASDDATRDAAVAAAREPARSIEQRIWRLVGDRQPLERVGAIWPSAFVPPGSRSAPWARSLDAAPPILWTGRDNAAGSHDELDWGELRATIQRFLEAIPLDQIN